jgi:hypothetical protein
MAKSKRLVATRHCWCCLSFDVYEKQYWGYFWMWVCYRCKDDHKAILEEGA